MTSTTKITTTSVSGNADQTVRLTAAQALIRYLQAQHSERDGVVQRAIPAIFGIFGHGNALGLGQAIAQEGRELPLYQPKNEQAMVHTALGYAKASRRLATLACTASIGPGSTNMLTGAATATTNRLPVLLLPSDTFANRRQGPVLQQLEHPIELDATVNDAFRPLSRFFDRIARPEQLLTALPSAMRVLLDPAQTGAVTIALHQDVQGEACDFPTEFFAPRVWPVTRRPPAPSEIKKAAAMLRDARRPLLIAGGGVRYSEAELALVRFASQFGIPVAETSAGKGSAAGSDWLVGGLGVNGTGAANTLARDADLVICVGTRLTDFTTGSHSLFQAPGVRFLSINVNPEDAAKVSATPVVADARETLEALSREIAGRRDDSYAHTVAQQSKQWEQDLAGLPASPPGEPLGHAEVVHTVNREVGVGDWVVAAAGYQPGDLLKLWRTPRGSHTHIEFGFSCMGHEIPAALGIRLREGPGAEVIVVIGDGSYLMAPSELVTAVQENLKLTVVLLDNGGYASIDDLALANAGVSVANRFLTRGASGRLPDGQAVKVDFLANATSMGCDARAVTTVSELRAALVDARAGDRTTVIVCPVATARTVPESGVFWDLGVPQVTADADTATPADDHRRRARAHRHY